MTRTRSCWSALGVLALLALVARGRPAADPCADRAASSHAAHAETGRPAGPARRDRAAVWPRRRRRPSPRSTEYAITDLGRPEEPRAAPPTIDRALFADLVLRETVVKAASLAHGVRRALAPETRNRIRFEMRREIRRARKQRRGRPAGGPARVGGAAARRP